MQRIVFTLAVALSFVACAEFEKSVNDLSKPIKGPSINAPNNVSVNVGTNGATGAQQLDGGAAPTSTSGSQPAQPPPGQPVRTAVTGTCEGSCAHYLACKNVSDAAYKTECVKGCVALKRPAQDLAQFESMDCATAIATVEKPQKQQAGAPATARGNGTCPAPMPSPRSLEDEKIFQASTTHVFCGFTYNNTTGTSREMQLRFLPDGTMVHQTKTERSGNTSAGSYGMVTSGGDRYCWKYGNGMTTWSSDGANYTQFVTKVEDNGAGTVFFQTKLGEYKSCQ